MAIRRTRAGTRQHPIKIYLWIWGLLFVLSTFSYLVDYFRSARHVRWTLILCS